MLGSDTARAPDNLRSLDYLAGLQAARADIDAAGGSPVVDSHALEVWLEPPLRGNHRMAAAMAKRGALRADMADLGHGGRV